jgi:hypothetical protein
MRMHARPQGQNVDDILARMDEAWTAFLGGVRTVTGGGLEVRLGDGLWTRKQMLAHVTTWHEMTIERLAKFVETGEPQDFEGDADAINARAARAAEGRTAGEVLLNMEESYRRLRREVGRLSDVQVTANDAWATAVIAGNSYDHYAEHMPDLEGAGGR